MPLAKALLKNCKKNRRKVVEMAGTERFKLRN